MRQWSVVVRQWSVVVRQWSVVVAAWYIVSSPVEGAALIAAPEALTRPTAPILSFKALNILGLKSLFR